MEVKKIREVIVSAMNDHRSHEPQGADHFVSQIVKLGTNSGEFNTYKLAWTKLTELLIILDKAGCEVLDAGDVLNITTYLLTSSVCIKDSATIAE